MLESAKVKFFWLGVSLFYLGAPARRRGRRFQASQKAMTDHVSIIAIISRRAVGLSATMIFGIHCRWAYAIRPCEHHLACTGVSHTPHAKNHFRCNPWRESARNRLTFRDIHLR